MFLYCIGRRARLSFTLLLIAGVVPSAFASGGHACRVEDPPGGTTAIGESLLASLPPRSAADLHSHGYVFPPEGIVPEVGCTNMVHVIVIFDVPLAQSMRLLGQTQLQGEYLRNLDRVRGIMRNERESIVQHDLKILFRTLHYQLHYHVDAERRRIWWSLEPSFANDLRDVRGYWQFLELESGQTVALYGTVVDAGPALPKRMQAALTRKSLRESIRNIRDWVHSHGSEAR